MKHLIIFSACLVLTYAQRPSYASSGPIGRPGLASRFKDETTSTSTTTIAFENRVGEDVSTPKIPVDARGDVDLVNTLNSWDREHQPFWFINADHIEKARNTTRGTQQTAQGQNTQITNRNQVGSQTNQDRFQGTTQQSGSSSQQGLSGNQVSEFRLEGNQDRLSGVQNQFAPSQTQNRNGFPAPSGSRDTGYASTQNEFANSNFRRPSVGSLQPRRYPYVEQDFDQRRPFDERRQSRVDHNIHYFF